MPDTRGKKYTIPTSELRFEKSFVLAAFSEAGDRSLGLPAITICNGSTTTKSFHVATSFAGKVPIVPVLYILGYG